MAVRGALDFLLTEADRQDARLTAVSSLARGGDVLFAEEVLSPSGGQPKRPLPWRCLLPFAWNAFMARDLAVGPSGVELGVAEREARRVRAEGCRSRSLSVPVVTSPHLDPDVEAQRNEAYLACGYRTVDESDVMIVLLRGEESARLLKEPHPDGSVPDPGTVAVATYAVATGRPVIVLDADAPDVWSPGRIINAPGPGGETVQWFFDPVVTPAIRRAVDDTTFSSEGMREWATKVGASRSTALGALANLGARLSARANHHQRHTLVRLSGVLLLHLAASSMAAVGATVLAVDSHRIVPATWLAALAAFALVKPALVFSAFVMESRLHRRKAREAWLHARVLAEMVRGAIATWPLPIQPAGALGEDDFPRMRRLVRTLHLLREQDVDAPARASPRQPGESQLDADMRQACERYVDDRLRDQATYYESTRLAAHLRERRWRGGFQVATWTAISLGLLLALDRAMLAGGGHLLARLPERVLEAAIIIAPFVAAYCLGMMAVLDTRRRCRRYHELEVEMRRLAVMLRQTAANPSRMRLITHAERLLLEEQHEWFSVARNVSV